MVMGTLVGKIVDNMGTMSTSDDMTTTVNQPLSVSVSIEGTTCDYLELTSLNDFSIMSSCGGPLVFSFDHEEVYFTALTSQGGKFNLLTNSLCAIERFFMNGNASPNSLAASIRNFNKALVR
jgi:hypothetical protein